MVFPLLTLVIVLMEFASSFISFLIGYYALKAYRASSSRGLFLFSLFSDVITAVAAVICFSVSDASLVVRAERLRRISDALPLVVSFNY